MEYTFERAPIALMLTIMAVMSIPFLAYMVYMICPTLLAFFSLGSRLIPGMAPGQTNIRRDVLL